MTVHTSNLAHVLAQYPARFKPGFAEAWHRVMLKLPVRTRDMLEKHYMLGQSCQQIAIEYGLTRQRVHQILSKAIIILRNEKELLEQLEPLPSSSFVLTRAKLETAYEYQQERASELWRLFMVSLSDEQAELLKEYRCTRAAIERLKRWFTQFMEGRTIKNAHEIEQYLPK